MSWMIFFLCLLLVFENFQTLSRFLWRLFCMFVSFQLFDFRICTSLTTWKKGSNKTSSSSVLVFCIFFIFRIFCISEFARKGPKRWKYGGHEASWPDVWEEYDSNCLAWASIAYYLSYAFCLHVIVIINTFHLIVS